MVWKDNVYSVVIKQSMHYNFMRYIYEPQDIVKVAHLLVNNENQRSRDPFWDDAAQLLCQSLIAYLKEGYSSEEQTLHNILQLSVLCEVSEDTENMKNPLDILMEDLEHENKDSYAVNTYKQFRIAASRTIRSILITMNAKLGLLDTPELNKMMSFDDVDIASIGKRKTALFVVVSDTDRSMDRLVNVFFSQAMNELCRFADKECVDNRLPVPVRFFLDDFATNCRIDEFPRMIASIRSRGISTVIMIQAESQLTKGYGYDDKTIIGNCDTYVYMGGNDVATAIEVSKRCDLPMKKILNMPVGTSWIFRRGEPAVFCNNFDIDRMLFEKGLLIRYNSNVERRI